jgi:hypothetical protein
MKNTADVTGCKPIAVLLQSISGVSAIYPTVTFYDIHGGNRGAIIFFPDTTLLLSTLIPLSGVGTTCFHHVVIKIRHLFYDQPPACRQPSFKLEGMLTTAKYSRDQQNLY